MTPLPVHQFLHYSLRIQRPKRIIHQQCNWKRALKHSIFHCWNHWCLPTLSSALRRWHTSQNCYFVKYCTDHLKISKHCSRVDGIIEIKIFVLDMLISTEAMFGENIAQSKLPYSIRNIFSASLSPVTLNSNIFLFVLKEFECEIKTEDETTIRWFTCP